MAGERFKPLIRNPKDFKVEGYRATNDVFLVEFGGEQLIIKRPRWPRWFGELTERMYVSQDKAFYGTGRQPSNVVERLGREVDVLSALSGHFAPKLFFYDEASATMGREYIEGFDFRSLLYSNGHVRRVLEGGLDATIHIHERDLSVGDNHIKNFLLGEDGTVHILDFEGKFDTSNPLLSRATDLLKFVYSTHVVTRSEELTLSAAKMISREYPEG